MLLMLQKITQINREAWFFEDVVNTLFSGIVFSLIISGTHPWIRESFGVFFYKNENILDIYWNTILIVLTLLLPFSLEIIQSLKTKYKGFGAELYFLSPEVRIYRLFWLLPLFSFTLIFLLNFTNEIKILSQVMIFIHAFGFYLWVTFLWYILRILFKSIDIMIDNNESMNKLFFDRLSDRSSENQIEEKWKAVWSTIDSLTEKWRKKFLGLFWTVQHSLIEKSRYEMAMSLFEAFSNSFLGLRDKDLDVQILYNSRKKWLWFNEKSFSDGESNPYSIFVGILEIYKIIYSKKQEREHNAFSFFERLKDVLDKIISNELKSTDDFYYGLFRQLKAHILINAESKEYLKSLPIYRPIFENANNYNLYSYSSTDEGFPNIWRMTVENLEKLGDETIDDVMRQIWYIKFIDWSRNRIQHGLTEFDSNLDSSLELLFPTAHKPWLALALGYRTLSWSGNRSKSLCGWESNFGFSGPLFLNTSWHDPSKTEEQLDREMNQLFDEQIRQSKINAAKIIKKFNLLGPISDIRSDLSSFEGETPKIENSRLELLELVSFIENC
jgi:hypothetical protein